MCCRMYPRIPTIGFSLYKNTDVSAAKYCCLHPMVGILGYILQHIPYVRLWRTLWASIIPMLALLCWFQRHIVSQPLDVVNVTYDCRFIPGLAIFPFLLLTHFPPSGLRDLIINRCVSIGVLQEAVTSFWLHSVLTHCLVCTGCVFYGTLVLAMMSVVAKSWAHSNSNNKVITILVFHSTISCLDWGCEKDAQQGGAWELWDAKVSLHTT